MKTISQCFRENVNPDARETVESFVESLDAIVREYEPELADRLASARAVLAPLLLSVLQELEKVGDGFTEEDANKVHAILSVPDAMDRLATIPGLADAIELGRAISRATASVSVTFGEDAEEEETPKIEVPTPAELARARNAGMPSHALAQASLARGERFSRASCSCGWTGPPRRSLLAVEADGTAHLAGITT